MILSCELAVDLQSYAKATSHCPSTQKRAAWRVAALAAVGVVLVDGITKGLELLADLQLSPAANQTGPFVAG